MGWKRVIAECGYPDVFVLLICIVDFILTLHPILHERITYNVEVSHDVPLW